jgi:hypothetical protein
MTDGYRERDGTEDQPAPQHHRRRTEDRWHITRDIPVVWLLGLMLAAAGAGATFWVSMHDLKAEVATLGPRMDRLESAMYRQTDATQAWQAQHDREAELNRRLTALENRVDAVLSGGIHVTEHIR